MKKLLDIENSIEPSEHQIQCGIVQWANLTKFGEKKIGDYLIAIPNGRLRNIVDAVKLKKEGVKAGVSDLFLALDSIEYKGDKYGFLRGGLWIEVKTGKGRLSKKQKEWFDTVSEFYDCIVVRSIEEGINAIKGYLNMR